MNIASTIRVLCWPPLAAELKSALALADGGPFEFVDGVANELESQLFGSSTDLVLLDEERLPKTMLLDALAAQKPLVLQAGVDGAAAAQRGPELAARWCAAMKAGVQDILSLQELAMPNGGLRLRAGVLRHAIANQARNAYSTDLATGLPHRQQLLEHMNHLLALREREPAPMAVLVLSVDGIATALQRLGSDAASVLRRKLAVRLRSGLRASDVVAAIDGENFAVLLSWVDNAANVEGVVAKLLASARRPFTLAGQPVSLAVRVGIGRYPEDGNDAATLLQKALIQATRQLNQGDLFARQVRAVAPAANDDGK